jgi:hypothetical protein
MRIFCIYCAAGGTFIQLSEDLRQEVVSKFESAAFSWEIVGIPLTRLQDLFCYFTPARRCK